MKDIWQTPPLLYRCWHCCCLSSRCCWLPDNLPDKGGQRNCQGYQGDNESEAGILYPSIFGCTVKPPVRFLLFQLFKRMDAVLINRIQQMPACDVELSADNGHAYPLVFEQLIDTWPVVAGQFFAFFTGNGLLPSATYLITAMTD